MDEKTRRVTVLGWTLHLTGLFVAIAGFALYVLVVELPLNHTTHETQHRISQVSKLTKTAMTIRSEHARLSEQLADCRVRDEETRRSMPNEPNEAEFLRQLTEAAGRGGVELSGFSRGKITPQAGYAHLDVTVTCHGSYESICRFLGLIQRLPRLSKVVTMSLVNESQKDTYPLDLTIRLFFSDHQTT